MNKFHAKKRYSQGEFWGKLMPNGTWNGMVGLFARGEADIGAANMFITALGGRKHFQEYTSPYGQEVRAHAAASF